VALDRRMGKTSQEGQGPPRTVEPMMMRKRFSLITILYWKYSEENNILEYVEKLQYFNMLQDFISSVIDNSFFDR
jgi:hypothetical protein